MIRREFVGVLLLVLLSVGRNAHAANFIPLGDFPEGAFRSGAAGISADGSTVVGAGNTFDDPGSTSDAFIWRQETGIVNLETIPPIEPRSSFGLGVSLGGEIAVGYLRNDSAAGQQAFRWSSATGLVGLGYLPGGSFQTSFAAEISANGNAIVGASSSVNALSEAFIWKPGAGMVALGDLSGGGFSSVATGISANGDVIVGASDSSLGSEAFYWTSATGMVGIGDLPGGFFDSGARAISSDGSTIVGYGRSELSSFSIEAFRWTAATGMIPLGDLPGGHFLSEAYGVALAGDLIVGTSSSGSGDKAFIWDEANGMRDLQGVLMSEFGISELSSWTLISANDITDDGLAIVGTGINPNGDFEGWLVRFDQAPTAPEPATSLIIVNILLGVLLHRRRRSAGK